LKHFSTVKIYFLLLILFYLSGEHGLLFENMGVYAIDSFFLLLFIYYLKRAKSSKQFQSSFLFLFFFILLFTFLIYIYFHFVFII